MKLPTDVSESTKRRNPDLYGRNAVGEVEAKITKPITPQTLVRDIEKLASRKVRIRTVCVVSLVAFLRREYDTDNLVGSMKPLRDSIAHWLGIDDRDARVRWQYAQVQTRGQEGIMVRIETV